MRFTPLATLTAALGVCATLAAITVSPAAPTMKTKHSMMSASVGMLVHGKAIAMSKCNGCHAANLAGKKGFSPSIRANGVLKEYNAQTFARVMNTGVTNDGGHVKPPMPVYHLPAKDSAALYAYLKTQK